MLFDKGKSVSASQAAGGLRSCGGVQPGELEICIALGVKPESIIYSGVMKEKCDIERAVSYGAGILTCESIRHAALISEVMLERMPEGAHEAGLVEKKAQVITAPDKRQPVWHVA